MNVIATLRTVALGSLLLSSLAQAQPARMMTPPPIPAIETHLQQQRTAEQREAMDKPVVEAASPDVSGATPGVAPPKKIPPKKRKPSRKQP